MKSKKGKCIVVSAPSGAGKTTIVHSLLEEIENLSFSISACSRLPRKNEENGKFYENALDFNRNKKIQFFFLGPENNWRKILKQKTILEIENKFNIEMKELKYI